MVFENDRSFIRLAVMNILTITVGFKKRIYSLFGRKPKTNSVFVDGLSKNINQIKEKAAGWAALDIVYKDPSLFTGFGEHFWLNIRNAQAVRNRFKVVKGLLREAVIKQGKEKTVNILSLACGSARAVLETCAEMKVEGYSFNIFLIDNDITALKYSRKLACDFGLEKQLETLVGDVHRTKSHLNRSGFKPDIIEMLGFMDYLDDRKAQMIIKHCFEALSTGGYFLTCHIHSNEEQSFLRVVVNWRMLYRSVAELSSLVKTSPFSEFQYFTEPQAIHTVVVCIK